MEIKVFSRYVRDILVADTYDPIPSVPLATETGDDLLAEDGTTLDME